MAILTAEIANMGKYAEGDPKWVTLSFPTTTQRVQEALRYIGVDGLRYEEIICGDFSSDIPMLERCFDEFSDLDEINYLASRLQVLSPEEREKFSAAIVHGESAGDIQRLINLTYNTGCYDLLPGIDDEEAYGRFLIENNGNIHLPESLIDYFDYEAYGEDTAINEGGVFTPYGYIFNNQLPFEKMYDGQNVPNEYRVFQYPMKSNIAKRRKDRDRKKEKPCR